MTVWARTRCNRWSPPCCPFWFCHDEGRRLSVVFWEGMKWLERCSLQAPGGSRYLHVKDDKDEQKVNVRVCTCKWRLLSQEFIHAVGFDFPLNELTKQLHDPASTHPLHQHEVKLSYLLFFRFSLMTMTSSPLDLLREGLEQAGLLLWSSSPTTGGHGTVMAAWLDREPSWSRNEGCSSPGQMLGHCIMFTAMLTVQLSLFLWSGSVCAACSYTWGGQKKILVLETEVAPWFLLWDCSKIIVVGRE